MYFANRGLSSFLVMALILMCIVLLLNMLPVILVVGAGVWAISYIVKKARKWHTTTNKTKSRGFETVKTEEDFMNTEFTSSNVIDVEYTEVK